MSRVAFLTIKKWSKYQHTRLSGSLNECLLYLQRVMFGMKFKHVYCQDCNILLARYNTRYFSDVNIAELVRIHYHSHIKEGHSLITRIADVL